MDNTPDMLRVGFSPTAESSNPFSDENAIADASSPLPDRPLSLVINRPSPVPVRPDPLMRSFHPPSVPTPEQPSHTISAALVPRPSFNNSTAYDPVPDMFAQSRVEPSYKPSRHSSLLSKLGSFKSLRASKRSRYGRLEDTEESGGTRTRDVRLKDVEEEDDREGAGLCLSELEGPIALRNVSLGSARSGERDWQAITERGVAGASIEEHHGLLGGGMNGVVEASEPIRRATMKRGNSSAKALHKEARRVAEKSGEILAVEAPMVDLSNFDGADYDARSTLNTVFTGTNGCNTKSYFFPPDPDMPAWKPISMRWSYISVLILIAVGLGALQEILCQMSIRRSKHDDGLLKFMQPQDLTMTQYFTWKYAPTIILLSYGILWQIVDFEVKRLEPYYQLSRPTGATAAESLNMDYLTSLSYLIPLKALHHRQWAVLYSSVATLIAGGLVPILQSASVQMYPEKSSRKEDEPKFVRIDPRWSRPMSASLFIVALCGILLLFKLRRKSGLLSDPKGIAGVAAMATRSHILQDFQGLDTAPQYVIHERLAHRRYILHKSSLWQGEYIRHSRTDYDERKATSPHPLMLTLKGGIPYIGGMILFMVLLPIVIFQPHANAVMETLPFLLTALATGIKLLWGALDCVVRMIEPFYILSRRHAPPRTLTLDYTGTMPGWLPVKAALNGHWLVALVGCGAILAEVLTVCVSSFSVDGQRFFPGQANATATATTTTGTASPDPSIRYNTDETFKSFWVSFGLSIGILLFLCAVATVTYAQRRHAFLPRQPGSIASVLAFIHQSNMLVGFVDTQRMNSARMTRFLEEGASPSTYALGWFRGRDGEDHCGIDAEPIAAEYRHGFDWRQGRVAGPQTWDVY